MAAAERETTTVLVADDDAMMLRLMQRFLEIDDSIVLVGQATDGREAVEKWRSLRPDVVVLDHMMPKVSGLDAVGQILAEDPAQRIVLLSALASDPSWVRSATGLGVSACIAKTEVSSLREVIRALH